MGEDRFELAVDGCMLRGHRGGSGAPALLLHGGAAVPDYLGDCAAQLDGLFETVRYTQRGTPPSDALGPYTIERHVADAVAVLDGGSEPSGRGRSGTRGAGTSPCIWRSRTRTG